MLKWFSRKEPAKEQPSPWLGLLDAFLDEVRAFFRDPNASRYRVADLPAGKAILELEPRLQIEVALEALSRRAHGRWKSLVTAEKNRQEALGRLVEQFLTRKKLPFDGESALRLAQVAAREYSGSKVLSFPLPGLLRVLEEQAGEHGLTGPLRAAIAEIEASLDGFAFTPDRRRYLERLRRLLATDASGGAAPALRAGDAWADTFLAELAALPAERAAPWHALLRHCGTASGAKPSRKWLGRAAELAKEVDREELVRIVAASLGRIGAPGSGPPQRSPMSLRAVPGVLDETQVDLLRGLVSSASMVDHPGLVAAIGQAAEASFKKIPEHGTLNVRVGNACLEALSRMGTPAAVAWLSRLRNRVQHAVSRKALEEALEKIAERQGLSKAELEEMAVPSEGLTDKEIKKLLPGQRDRLERLYLHPRDWDFPTWRERYLDHPLVGTLARRLIWRFGKRTGLWREDRIVDAEGEPLEDLDGVRVSLWHPLDSPADEALAWRTRLESWEVVQPFKQAHREIYLLTAAEQQTATYSNRFAAHVLKQHQFAALCKQRGWTYSLQGAFDSHSTPTLLLPEHRLRVEFWVDGVGETSDLGIYLHVTTDQVRFCDLAGEPRYLARVPPLLFTELMRDVDLFVGVCSVGNDPNWADGGERPGIDYWREFSFGDLGETARTRRELLGRLVPRLKIADRCTLTDRFLVVRGDRRTYKIHLGSSNILMKPNDQYLCIVLDRSHRAERTILPFEGDGILALILSKAFLLAEDTKITDRQILSQLGR